MSWQITVSLGGNADKVGRVSATWTDPTLGTFTYARASKATQARADAFIVEAIAARDAWKTIQSDNESKAAWVLDRLNTADPKV